MSFGVAIAIAVIGILLICSALISGAEIAYFSLSPKHLDELEENDSKTNQRVLALIERPKRLLATILIANNFVNVGIIILSSYIIDGMVDLNTLSKEVVFLLQVVSVTLLILLLGEVLPKIYATSFNLEVAKFMSSPLKFLRTVFRPLSWVLIGFTSIIDSKIKTRNRDFTVDDLEKALDLTHDDTFKTEEEKILKGIVQFGNKDVKQIMTPRVDVTTFSLETGYRELVNGIIKSGYSRIPIYRDSFDQVEGILYLKDLLAFSDLETFDWQKLIRKGFFVPENKKIDDLLRTFQELKMHLAIVVDEYGGTSGIVTLEDVIEEIVGEITDEFDDDDVIYSKLDDDNYVFEGKTPLIDVYRIMNIAGDEFEKVKGESDTLAGFVLEMSGRIPLKNERIKFNDYLFTIEAADKRKVKQVKVSLISNDMQNS